MGSGDDRLAQGLRALGVARRRFEILRFLLAVESDEVTTAQLMAETRGSHATVRHHLDALMKDGLVSQRHSAQPNGRGLLVHWRPDRDAIREAVETVARATLGD